MQLCQRRHCVTETTFAIQQRTRGTQHPLGSHAAALAVDCKNVQETCRFDEDGERAPPVTPLKRTEGDWADEGTRRSSLQRSGPTTKRRGRRRRNCRRGNCRRRLSFGRNWLHALPCGPRSTSAWPSSLPRRTAGATARTPGTLRSRLRSTSCSTGTGPTSSLCRRLRTRAAGDAHRAQSDDGTARTLVGGSPVSWAEVLAVDGLRGPTFTVDDDGVAVSSSARAPRGAKPTTVEDLTRHRRPLPACVADVDGSGGGAASDLHVCRPRVFGQEPSGRREASAAPRHSPSGCVTVEGPLAGQVGEPSARRHPASTGVI